MRSFWNSLGDPGLHLLLIALFMAYLAFSRGSSTGDQSAEAPLPYCKACRIHYLPGKNCECRAAGHIAQILP